MPQLRGNEPILGLRQLSIVLFRMEWGGVTPMG
jgi:hypothetical protein